MFRIEEYLETVIAALKEVFSTRLLFVGLLGSYLRGEATEDSDIDIMVILEDITVADLDYYRDILISLGHYDKSCGFICGKEELQNWNPLEICQLIYTTKDCYGKLEELVPEYTRQDEVNYVKESVSNLFHEVCHRYVHSDRENNMRKLPMSYKNAFFIIQNIYFLESGSFVLAKRDLLEVIAEEDKAILERAIALKNGDGLDFDEAYSELFMWCKNAFKRCEEFSQSLPRVRNSEKGDKY